MRQYIKNLTNHLTVKNHYGDIFQIMDAEKNMFKFIDHVRLDLLVNDVQKMSPETLGRIMCALKDGDILMTKESFTDGFRFNRDCEEMFRNLVSLYLTHAIWCRLNNREDDLSAVAKTQKT